MDLGLERAGWQCVGQVEKDEYRQRVLAQHWPSVPRWGDVTALDPADLPPCDLIAGGFPCQDISQANAERTGLAGARSGLFWELVRVVRAVRPRWLLIENVPGLFSSPGGERAGQDFGTVLDALDDLGYFVEWRTVDSRYYGVPQRRRRVLAGHLGGPPAQPVLFEPEGSAGSPAPGAEAQADTAVPLTSGVGGGSCHPAGRRSEDDFNLVASTLGGGTPGQGWTGDIDRNGGFVASRTDGAEAPRLSAKGNRFDGDSDDFVCAFGYDLAQMTSGANRTQVRPGTALPLNGSGQESVAYVLGSHGFTTIDRNEAPPLRIGNCSPETVAVSGEQGEWRVRRYTPTERERLQGLPDGWTCLCDCEPYSTSSCKCSDGPRERATGDAVTVPVADWLGRRLANSGAAA
jgi:DNA (cytosine-5)-methyltransferase 1